MKDYQNIVGVVEGDILAYHDAEAIVVEEKLSIDNLAEEIRNKQTDWKVLRTIIPSREAESKRLMRKYIFSVSFGLNGKNDDLRASCRTVSECYLYLLQCAVDCGVTSIAFSALPRPKDNIADVPILHRAPMVAAATVKHYLDNHPRALNKVIWVVPKTIAEEYRGCIRHVYEDGLDENDIRYEMETGTNALRWR